MVWLGTLLPRLSNGPALSAIANTGCIALSAALLGSTWERALWRLLMFLGRYAHQPVTDLLMFTRSDLHMMAEETAKILTEENTPKKE